MSTRDSCHTHLHLHSPSHAELWDDFTVSLHSLPTSSLASSTNNPLTSHSSTSAAGLTAPHLNPFLSPFAATMTTSAIVASSLSAAIGSSASPARRGRRHSYAFGRHAGFPSNGNGSGLASGTHALLGLGPGLAPGNTEHLPAEEIMVLAEHLPPNPEDDEEVVPQGHAAFGIVQATGVGRERGWRDTEVLEERVRGVGLGEGVERRRGGVEGMGRFGGMVDGGGEFAGSLR